MLSDIGAQVTSTALPLLVLSLTGSAADAGFVGVAGTIAYPIAALPSGVLADRIERRRLMMACALSRLAAIASVPVAFIFGRPSLVQLLVVAVANATLFATSSVAERGLIGDIVAPEAYPDAVTLNEARSAVAYTAGPPLGGVLFGLTRGLPFIVDAASFLAVFWTALRVRVPTRQPEGDPGTRSLRLSGIVQEAKDGARWLLGQPFAQGGRGPVCRSEPCDRGA